MNHLLITLSVIYIITLSGCTSQKTRLVQQGYPSAYAEGYYHGCREGKYQSNSHYNQRKAERIKTKTQALITKILEENKDNQHLNLKTASKEEQKQQSSTTQIGFKAITTEFIPIEQTNTHQLFDNLSHDTQVKSRNIPTKQKLNTVSDYMYKNAHINKDWSERDFQYENGWSNAFFECQSINATEFTASRQQFQTDYGMYRDITGVESSSKLVQLFKIIGSSVELIGSISSKKVRKRIQERDSEIGYGWQSQKRQLEQQQTQEFQRQHNLELQQFREQSTTIVPLPSIDKNQLIQQQLEWDHNLELSPFNSN
jgi:hypothetical protein